MCSPYPVEQISIHALRGEGDHRDAEGPGRHVISIHALRGEGDRRGAEAAQCADDISIHALRGEGDPTYRASSNGVVEFLSTPSVGRATDGDLGRIEVTMDFYPRPPWGGRRSAWRRPRKRAIFLSTPSVGRATGGQVRRGNHAFISIHALRGEGDERFGRKP